MEKKEINLDFSIKIENEAKVAIMVKVPASIKKTLERAKKFGISTTHVLIEAAKSLEKQLPKD